MGRELTELAYDHDQKLWRIEVSTADGRPRKLHGATRHLSAPVRELVEKTHADADLAAARARAALSRLPHRRADGEEAGSVPRQLDLHPRSVGEGRPRAELPLLVARDGASPA